MALKRFIKRKVKKAVGVLLIEGFKLFKNLVNNIHLQYDPKTDDLVVATKVRKKI